MDTFLAAIIAAGITLFFVRGYLKKLTASQRGAGTPRLGASEEASGTRSCPRCTKAIARGTAFCPHCGAPLALWSVHTAPVQVGGNGSPVKGKPKPAINASLCVGCGSCVHECPENGTLELLNGKAILSHAERCVGHAKCVEVCPTGAIMLTFEGILQTVRVPHVKENFETNLPGVFIAGELAGMGLIKTAINEGKLAIDNIHARFEASRAGESSGMFDVAIVGAGPAGLSASLTAHQRGLNYVTFEQSEVAATIRQYPRQKFLMAEPIELPLYGSLYVADGTKEALLAVWETILHNTGVRVRSNERVGQIVRDGEAFRIATVKGSYLARCILLAMGRRGTPRRLGVRGEDLAKVSYRLIEAETYQHKNLLVVGGGDSAIEAALALSRARTNNVALSYRGENFSRARERNRQSLEAAAREGKLRIIPNSQVAEICPESVALSTGGAVTELPNDFTFILIGGESPEDFLRKTGVEIVEKALSA